MICEGDPLFYGSYMHLHARLAPRFPTEIVAGVTGMSGCWSAAGMPIAQGDDVFTVLPATLPEGELARRLADADAAVVMKVGRHLPKLRRALETSGRLAARHLCRARHHGGRENDSARRQARRDAPYFAVVLVPGWEERPMSGGISPSSVWARAMPRYLTPEADDALGAAQALYGYGPYLDRVPVRAGQSRHAVRQSRRSARAPPPRFVTPRQGARVAVVSGGDPGVFAMAAAVCEEIEAGPESWRALDVTHRARHHGDAGGRGADRRAARPRFLRAVAVRQSQAVGRWSSAGSMRRRAPASSSRFTIRCRGRGPWQFGDAIERLRRHLPATTPVVFGRAVGRPDERVSVATLDGRRRDACRHGDAGDRRHRARRASSRGPGVRRSSTRRAPRSR